MSAIESQFGLGRYKLGRPLGSGAMGEVYEATDEQSQRVAMKLMNRELARDPLFRERFLREVHLMQAMQHPNIIPIIDYGWHEDRLYLVMQFIDGATLRDRLDDQFFSPLQTWTILKPLMQAIAHAHRQGIIHRDLKPHNVLIEAGTNHVYLGDFGLSKRPGIDARLTEPGAAVGTPYYMSPESVLGEELDERSDLYSLGIMTYQLLLNRVPFDGGNTDWTCYAHAYEPLPLPSATRPDFPPELEIVLLTALAKDRAERYASIAEFAVAFSNALRELTEMQLRTQYGMRPHR